MTLESSMNISPNSRDRAPWRRVSLMHLMLNTAAISCLSSFFTAQAWENERLGYREFRYRIHFDCFFKTTNKRSQNTSNSIKPLFVCQLADMRISLASRPLIKQSRSQSPRVLALTKDTWALGTRLCCSIQGERRHQARCVCVFYVDYQFWNITRTLFWKP